MIQSPKPLNDEQFPQRHLAGPDLFSNLISRLARNERLQGVPRPILEVCADELIKILNARIPEDLREQGLDVLQSNWVAMKCIGCGRLTPAPRVSERFNVTKAALCPTCKGDYKKKVEAIPSAPSPHVVARRVCYEYTDADGKIHRSDTRAGIPVQYYDQAKRVELQMGALAVLKKLDEEHDGGLAAVVEEAAVRRRREFDEAERRARGFSAREAEILSRYVTKDSIHNAAVYYLDGPVPAEMNPGPTAEELAELHPHVSLEGKKE